MGIVEMQQDETILMLYGNRAVAKHIGDTKNVIVQDKFLPPGMLDKYRALYKKSREMTGFVKEELSLPDLDIFTEATVSCISYDKEKGVSRHVYIVADKKGEKREVMALESYRMNLEMAIQARTRELKEKEIRFSSSNAPNIILSVDNHGVIEFANRNFINDDASQLIGKYLYTLVVEGQELMKQLHVLFETKKSFTCEVKLIQKEMWLTLSAGPMNEFLAIIVATDITESKKMSEELNHALATKSRFLANMSHEVRTPLSGIIGMSRMLQETGLTLDQAECVSTIQYCGETLLSVINSILDYTKLENTNFADTMAMDRSEISLQQCLEESLYQRGEKISGFDLTVPRYAILPAARQKKLELVLDIDPKAPDRILGDIIRLRQVMLNLLNNAVKFTDEGYIALSLTAHEIDGTDDWKFDFSICDTGCGVPAGCQGKLFKMFSQVDVSTTRRYGGTGIGLALAKRFLEMMQGEITLQSSGIPGEGSKFLFSIIATPTPFVPISPSNSSNSPRWLVRTTNIFIVEPCKLASEVLRKRLHAKGFMSVKIYNENPYEALDEIQKFSTSPGVSNTLVFCDIDHLTPSTPYPLSGLPNVVTVLMGYLRPQTCDTQIGKHEFLRKPIKETTLLACLREVWSVFETNSNSLRRPLERSNSNSKSRSLSKQVLRPNSPKPPPQTVYPLTILVVEDNEINQKVVRRVFQHLGYTISMANNGAEALNYIEQNGLPDIILMDVQMPIMDGIQTTKIIRDKYAGSWVYITAMTANAFPEDKQSCFDAGMDDFLTKPLRIEHLQTSLHNCHKIKLAKRISPLRVDVEF